MPPERKTKDMNEEERREHLAEFARREHLAEFAEEVFGFNLSPFQKKLLDIMCKFSPDEYVVIFPRYSGRRYTL